MAALCRRGKQKLRNIESSSHSSLKLDASRGVLEIRGSKASVAEVQLQIKNLSGPCIAVTAAVWAELMRTRTHVDSSQSSVAIIQEKSGCRMHIDRHSRQVRLFGPEEATDVAQQLLRKLDSMCSAVTIVMNPAVLVEHRLHGVAQEFGVTLLVQDRWIVVLGLAGAIVEAAEELRNAEEGNLFVSRTSILKAMSDLREFTTSSHDLVTSVSCSSTTEGNLAQTIEASLRRPEGCVRKELPPGPCPRCGAVDVCGHSGQRSPQKTNRACPAPCARCNVARFCAYCGSATSTLDEMTAAIEHVHLASALPNPTQSKVVALPHRGQKYSQDHHRLHTEQKMQAPSHYFGNDVFGYPVQPHSGTPQCIQINGTMYVPVPILVPANMLQHNPS